MPEFRFSGRIDQGRGENPFEREVEGESLEHAKDRLYAELGSEHSVPRSRIDVEEEEEVNS